MNACFHKAWHWRYKNTHFQYFLFTHFMLQIYGNDGHSRQDITYSIVVLLMSTCLYLLVSPDTSSTFFFSVFNFDDRNFTNSLFASPSTGSPWILTTNLLGTVLVSIPSMWLSDLLLGYITQNMVTDFLLIFALKQLDKLISNPNLLYECL